MERLLLITRNMRRNLRRTILTALTIALATFVFTVLISVPASMDHIIKDTSKTLRVVVNNRTGPWYDLPPRYCDQIEKMKGVVACAALTGWPAKYHDARDGIQAFAVSDNLSRVFPDYGLSERASLNLLTSKRAAFVGKLLAKKYDWKVGQQVTLRSTDASQMDMTFVIADVIPSDKYPNSFIMRRGYLNESMKAAGHGDYDLAWFLFARVDRAENIPMVTKEIDETFRNSDYETRTATEADAISNGLSAIGNIRGIVFSLSAVVILTVLLIAANATAMMVRDRIAEVAVLKAIGFTPMGVGVILAGECLLIGLIGGVIGAGAAYWMFFGGKTLGAVTGGLGYLAVPGGVAVEGLFAALIVSLISVAIPGFSALRITPAAAFRQIV